MALRSGMSMKQPIKYFSMFSGIGGFEYGMEQSDYRFECVGYSEIDKYARSIYERHYPNHINYGDATRIRTSELPDFDLLVGGFPCQAFSVAGKRRGFDDTRGTLFFEIARILKDKRPRYFLLENVKGLLSHDKGRTFKTMLGVLADLGYYVQWEILNSKDWVPQNRERIFIKGYSRRCCGREVLSVPRVDKAVDEPMSNTYYGVRAGRVHKDDEIMNTLACSGHNGANSQLIQINDKKQQAERIYDSEGLAATLLGTGSKGLYKINTVKKGKHQSGNVYGDDWVSPCLTAVDYKRPVKIVQPVLTPERENKRQNGRRMKDNDEEMFTLTATDKHGVYDGITVRKLTPVECERLQGFPDNWTQYGKDNEPISDTQRYKCCGNAVTTNVITAIINEMFKEVIEDEND